MVDGMRTTPSTHRRGLLAGLLMLTASVSGAVAIASGGTTPTTPTTPASSTPASPTAAAAVSPTADDRDRGAGSDGREGRRANIVNDDDDRRR
jgi:hypothetical protein